MKKAKRIISIMCAAILSLGCITACDEEPQNPSNPQSGVEQEGGQTPQNPSPETPAPETPALPTAQEVVAARKSVVDETKENYDFSLSFAGNFSVLGHTANLDAKYDGQYRYDEATGSLQFKRTTSGMLLNDATEYVSSQGDQKIKVNIEDDGSVKKVAVVPTGEEGLTLINLPFVSLIDSLTASEITQISETTGEYAYKATLNLSAENQILNKILSTVGGLGTTISIKGVEFTNPTSGIEMLFNLNQGKLDTFQISAQVGVPVKAVDVTMDLVYKQKGASSTVSIPSTSGIAITQADISTKLNTVNSALNSLKAQDDYSLDLLAKNEFDPAWNVTATVDQYQARLYKNTVGSNVWFNHSFMYKAHHETDGQEAYKYTLGNLNDGQNSVYLVSRRGTNAAEAKQNVSVDTQFDYLTSMVKQTADKVDCITTKTEGTSTFYHVHLNKTATIAVQDSILDLINSNEGEGVVDVNNYFNTSEYTVEEAEIVVEMVSGSIKNIQCLTELKYAPTGGEYTEYNVTLTNTIELAVNQNLDKASEYVAPEKLEQKILGVITGGLMFASYYIM